MALYSNECIRAGYILTISKVKIFVCLVAGGAPVVRVSPHAVRGPRAVRAAVPAPGHAARGDQRGAAVRGHAAAARQALLPPRRRKVRLSRSHTRARRTLRTRHVSLFTMIRRSFNSI